ncbi:MAG: hypothetical protein QM706_17660 [Nitrospira sp.]
MATEITRVEWHLTPRGWVRGNWGINVPLGNNLPVPVDRIETWLTIETIPAEDRAPKQKDWNLVWVSPLHSEMDRKHLRATIRKPAPGYESRKEGTHWDFPSSEF